jgi:hypothetical protein
MAEAEPYTPAELVLLTKVRTEVEAALKSSEHERKAASENLDYYHEDNARYIGRKPAESDDDYRDRPKWTSSMTKRAIEVLGDHLYASGPSRKIEDSPAADEWLERAYADNHVDALWQNADKLSTLNGTAALQVAATGDPDRPIKVHLWERSEFEVWAEPGDPLKPFAVVVIDRLDEQTTYTIYTRLEVLVYRTKKLALGQTAGGRVATFVPRESYAHGYGVLPFAWAHDELPVRTFVGSGIGTSLRRANHAIDEALSDLANAIRFYGRPLGFTRNVAKDWRPVIRPGSFNDLPGRERTAGGPGTSEPEAFYLQAALDIAGINGAIVAYANSTFEEKGVPLSAVRLEQTGVVSGIAIVAEQAPLLTRAKKRQRPYGVYEHDLARVCLNVGGSYYDSPELAAAAADVHMTLTWAEPRIPIPGPDRDLEDQSELEMGLTSTVQILQRRRGLTREQAIGALEQIATDQAELATIRAKHAATTTAANAAIGLDANGQPKADVAPGKAQGNDPGNGDDSSQDDDTDTLEN